MLDFFFDPTASATAYGQRPKFFWAEHSATAEGENCAYGPTLLNWLIDTIELINQVYDACCYTQTTTHKPT